MPSVEETSRFDFRGDERGVLCVHGYTGTPFEVRILGERLAERGFTVVGPVLAGHGGRPEDLNRTTWHDWVATVDGELDLLRARCSRVAVVGLSLGGLLALHVARQRGADLAAIASMGTPLWLPWYAPFVVPVAARIARFVPKLAIVPSGPSDISDPNMKSSALPVHPVFALHSLLEFTGVVRGEIAEVTAPALIVHGGRDHSAPPACADELMHRLGSRDKRLLLLERSCHVVTLDVERDRLGDEVGAFLSERMPA